jgi:hypothetical protein
VLIPIFLFLVLVVVVVIDLEFLRPPRPAGAAVT